MKKTLWILCLMIGSVLWAEGIRVPAAFSADFLQKVTNPAKKVILYKGQVRMKAPATLKWIYREPTRKEVCSDGKKVVVVDHDLEQVSFYRMEKSFDLTFVLRKARHHRDNLYVAKYGGRNYTIALDSQGRISQIAYRDDMDNVVNIHFSRVRYLTKAPAPSGFRCRIPDSYDRIGG